MASELDAFMEGAGLTKAADAEPQAEKQPAGDDAAAIADPAAAVDQSTEPETDAADAGLEKDVEPGTDATDEKEGSGKPGRNDDENDDEPKMSRRQLKRMRYEMARLRKRNEELERERTQHPVDQAPATPATVDRTAFKSDADYFEALVKTRMAEERAEQARLEREELERSEGQRAFVTAWSEKVKSCFPSPEAQQQYLADMEEAFDGKPGDAFNDDVSGYVFQHPKGPAILQYLANHPTTCERLRSAHPFDQAEIMRKIVAYVDRPVQAAPANAGQQQGRKPVAPVGSIRTGAPASDTANRTAEELFLAAVK